MQIRRLTILVIALLCTRTSFAADSQPPPKDDAKPSADKQCLAILTATVRKESVEHLASFCSHVERLPLCQSTAGEPIFHSDSMSSDQHGKRILVLGMIHGDEPLAGEMALEWTERLKKIDHRNNWRLVPLLNPDGLHRQTRMNANGVDLNRNFPTKDWSKDAIKYWQSSSHSDPRRFPGSIAASESETKCVMAQIQDFKPDFIVSIHTPYHVLDFDGPKVSFPAYKDLPWRALGNYPGSLGRFMWKDFQIPVLTIELGTSMVDAAKLQDVVGSFAIKSLQHSSAKKPDFSELR